MATTYEKTAGALIATPGRTVATFPSGLCRVDQTYVCTTAHAATHRAALAIGNDMPDGNEAPAIDGLKIFPAPQETERGDGFTEFSVSAYGRTSREMTNIELLKQDIDVSSTWTRMATKRSQYANVWQPIISVTASGVGYNDPFIDGFRSNLVRIADIEVPEARGVNDPNSSVSFWEIKGKIAIPRGTRVQFEDLNIDPVLLDPFDAVYYGDDKTVLSVTAEKPFIRTDNLSGSGNVTTKGRYYSVVFTTDGVNPSGTWKIFITDPVFTVASQQSYGEFVEVDVVSRRNNSQQFTAI